MTLVVADAVVGPVPSAPRRRPVRGRTGSFGADRRRRGVTAARGRELGGVGEGVGCRHSRSDRVASARGCRTSCSATGPRRDPRVRERLRRLPHRPAPRRRRPRRRVGRVWCPGTRSSAASTRWALVRPVRDRRPRRRRLARAHLRLVPVLSGGATRTCASRPRFTGWDDDGGYAEYGRRRRGATPTRCRRRVRRRRRPRRCCAPGSSGTARCAALRCPSGGRLGIYGFGGSAHLAAQVAHARGRHGARPDPSAERAAARARARRGLRRRRDDAPARAARRGDPVRAGRRPRAASRCAALDRGGTLAIAGIHLSDIPPLATNGPLRGATLRWVTANTRRDGEELLAIAARARLHVVTTPYELDRADQALT